MIVPYPKISQEWSFKYENVIPNFMISRHKTINPARYKVGQQQITEKPIQQIQSVTVLKNVIIHVISLTCL